MKHLSFVKLCAARRHNISSCILPSRETTG